MGYDIYNARFVLNDKADYVVKIVKPKFFIAK